jgi:hypothetical protein
MSSGLLVLLVLLVGVGLFFALRFTGFRTNRVTTNFNYTRGDARTTGEIEPGASSGASHREETVAGEGFAGSGSTKGVGTATANSELGHEFEYVGRAQREFEFTIDFEYRARAEVIAEPARANAGINVLFRNESPNYANLTRTTVGTDESPAGGGWTREIRSFRHTMNSGDKVSISANAFVTVSVGDAAAGRSGQAIGTAEFRVATVTQRSV